MGTRAATVLIIGLIGLVCDKVGAQQTCVPVPEGCTAWWRAEGDFADAIGGNGGTAFNGATFAGGMAGWGFSFDGLNQCVLVSNTPSLNPTSGLTLECWLNASAFNSSGAVCVAGKENPSSTRQYMLGMALGQGNQWIFRAHLGTQTAFRYFDGQTAIQLGTWYHVAMTYDGADLRLYVNGVPDGSLAANGSVVVSTHPFVIGGRPSGPWNFMGVIDEVALYGRALSLGEIQAVYAAGTAGKCAGSIPPCIFTPPASQTVTAGSNATLSVQAGGSVPLSYQWLFNGADLPNATNALLALTNIQFSQAGAYSARVTNVMGTATSPEAWLTVNPPSCATAPTDIVSWWPANGHTLDAVGGNHATLAGSAVLGQGRVEQGLVLDGAPGGMQIGNPANLQLQDFTIEAWVKRANTNLVNRSSTLAFIFGYGIGGYGFMMDATGGLMLTKVGVNNVRLTSPLVADTNFHHVAVTKAGNTVTFYVDTVAYPAMAYDPGFVFSTPVAIGAQGDTLASAFWGTIDELAVYSRALSAGEISQIYGAAGLGKCMAPIAPYFLTEPSSQTVLAEESILFNVASAGAVPMACQWMFQGSPIPGATNWSLFLTNVQFSQGGAYAVQLSNAFGIAVSSNAILTVGAPPVCMAPPPGLLGWWRGELTGTDAIGGNSALLKNGAGYGVGIDRKCFLLGSGNQYLEVPDAPNLNPADGLTVEAWVYPTAPPASGRYVLAKDDGYGNRQYLLNLVPSGTNTVARAHVGAQSGFAVLTGTTSVPTNAWTHVCMTYDGAAVRLYVNGRLDSSLSASGPVRRTTQPIRIGSDGAGTYAFQGSIDEVSLYGRALSAAEVQAAFEIGGGGKCSAPVPPIILTQPLSQVGTLRSNVTFSVVAGGSVPITCQWRRDGEAIAGATNAAFAITNAGFADEATYSVIVSNAGGVLVSSNAILTITYPTAVVKVAGTNVNAGGTVDVPILIAANGNENAVAFSLGFDPARLAYTGAVLGNDAAGAVLVTNISLTPSGKVGLAVVLPPDVSFSPGMRLIAKACFAAAVLTNTATTAISFVDQPTPRQLLDARLNLLAAYHSNATVTINAVAGFEGDVFPRGGGDKSLSLTDWLLLGRYAARLDYPTNSAEFQRADSAPAQTLGDGVLTVADWVQAGRFAFGLDALVGVGGPVSEAPASPPPASAERTVTATGAMLAPGQLVAVPIWLSAQGGENALGFTLTFDPARVSFNGATLGADAVGATLRVNSTQAPAGRAGIALALSPGNQWPTGARELVVAQFTAMPGSSGGFVPGFGDWPVIRQVADLGANALAVSFDSVLPPAVVKPSLSITRLGAEVTVSWPLWASNFTLQEAVGQLPPTASWTNAAVQTVVTTNNEHRVYLPGTGPARFYRLSQPSQ